MNKPKNEVQTEPRDLSIHPSPREQYSFLYVEDDPVAIHFVSLLLRGLYLLDTATTGELALKMVQEKQYDAILMDINLRRGMDGLEVSEVIRTMQGYKDTPIIAVTAYDTGNEKEEFLSRGLTHYLSKPFTRHDLLSLMESVFSK